MEIAFSDERVFAITETLNWEEAKERAWDRKTAVFGTGLGKLFTRPKPDDIKISDQQKRWEPFWHVRCASEYVYDRTRHYQIPIPQAEVRTVVVDEREYIPSGDPRGFTLVGLEKCREESAIERFVDATDAQQMEWDHYLEFDKTAIDDLAGWKPEESVVVPPQVRASTVVREALNPLIKPLDADTIHKDLVTIEFIDLYFRPIYAFEFLWVPKDRKAVAEFDGLTGSLITDGATIMSAISRTLTPEVLLDVGVDAIDLLVPGGGIAIKLAKAVKSSKK